MDNQEISSWWDSAYYGENRKKRERTAKFSNSSMVLSNILKTLEDERKKDDFNNISKDVFDDVFSFVQNYLWKLCEDDEKWYKTKSTPLRWFTKSLHIFA
jgi:transcriptional regulator of met regulon